MSMPRVVRSSQANDTVVSSIEDPLDVPVLENSAIERETLSRRRLGECFSQRSSADGAVRWTIEVKQRIRPGQKSTLPCRISSSDR